MRKVIYAMLVSLDGFIEAPNGDISWTNPDDELHQHFNDQEAGLDILFYGRRLYETMTAFWPTADQDPAAPRVVVEYAKIWKEKKKIVFSKTLQKVEWNSQLFRGDIAQEINRFKAQPGMDMSVGGAGLATTFMELGLIDEFQCYIHPVILGSGKPMFPHLRNKIDLKLVETRAFGSGVVMLRYCNVSARE